ncbi:TPA: CDP-alcohol phosphatidyltransferase family protein [Photobacterium damselae]
MNKLIYSKSNFDTISLLILYPFVFPLVYGAKFSNKITPNKITLFGFLSVLTGAIFTLYYQSYFGLGFGLFMFTVMDSVDGLVARVYSRGSELGALLDILTDRFSLFVVYLTIMFICWNDASFSYHSYILISFYMIIFYGRDVIALIILNSNILKRIKDNSNNARHDFLKKPDRFTSQIMLAFYLISNNEIFILMAIVCVFSEYTTLIKKVFQFIFNKFK